MSLYKLQRPTGSTGDISLAKWLGPRTRRILSTERKEFKVWNRVVRRCDLVLKLEVERQTGGGIFGSGTQRQMDELVQDSPPTSAP